MERGTRGKQKKDSKLQAPWGESEERNKRRTDKCDVTKKKRFKGRRYLPRKKTEPRGRTEQRTEKKNGRPWTKPEPNVPQIPKFS